MIKAILFDMDGTLTDSERFYTCGTYEWLKANGYKGTIKAVYKIVGTTMEETYRITAELLNTSKSEAERLNTEYFLKHKLNYHDYIFPETIDTLKTLKQMGIKIVICSQSNNKEVRQCIEEMGISEYIDFFICSDDLTKHKPEPEIYLKAIERLNIKKDEALVVEDSTTGIKAGKAAGIYTLARKDEVYGLDQSLADKIIKSLLEVIDEVKLHG